MAAAPSTELAVRTPPAAGTAPVLVKLKTFWGSRDKSQKLYLAIGGAVLVGAVAFLSQTMSTPEYKPVASGLEAADASALSAQLAAKGIQAKVGQDGTSVTVPADKLDAARMEAASQSSPRNGRIGFEIFDKVSWGETEFDEKVNYQRALEGELERTIQTMSNVKTARVHLVMANSSIFVDRDRPAKASVTMRLRRGTLTKDEAAAITRLVSGAVDNLKPEDVALVDADSNKSLNSNGANNELGTEAEQEMSKRLVATLAPIVGTDGVHATVNVDYDNTSSEESQDKYDPSVTVPLNVQKSEEVASNGAGETGGIPGTSSNIVAKKEGEKAAAPAAASAQPGQSSKSESATYGVNRTTTHTISPGGRIHRITAAVLVDDVIDRHQEKGKWVESRHKRSPEEMKTITELAQAAIGFDTARGDVVSVQNLSFSHPQEEEAPKATFVEKAQKQLHDNSSLVRYGMLGGALLFVYLLMIRPIQKRVLAMPDPAETAHLGAGDLEIAPLPITSEDLAARSLALKKQLAEFVRKEPQNSATTIRAWLREEVQ